jgi:hypothetical protein
MSNTSTTTQSSQSYTPTSTESALMSNELALSNAALPGELSNVTAAQGLQSAIMGAGGANINQLTQGVSPGQSQNEAQMGLQGLATTAQAMGGLDSGSYQQAGANAYANTLNSNAQFNIENLAQLMNLASGNAYQNVGGISSNNAMLGTQSGALASSSGNSTVSSNPFLNSFYSGLGNMANGQTETQAYGQSGQTMANFF